MLIGTYNHTIDAKGRMFVPANLRKHLGDEFYVTISGDGCLYIYSLNMWERAMNKLMESQQENHFEISQLFASASHCVPDGQGRIPLTQDLRDFAGLSKNVTIVGIGLYVQIWDSEKYEEHRMNQRKPENIKEAIRKLGL